MSACAARVSVEEKVSNKPSEINPKSAPIFKLTPSDNDYLRYGISLISGAPGVPQDYEKAKIAFETLLKEHPDSKWKDSTTALIKIIHDFQDCQEKEKASRALLEKNANEKKSLISEKDKLSKANNELNEKMQSEIVKLIQENERLKKDIELLKNLEIKLDKRERLLH